MSARTQVDFAAHVLGESAYPVPGITGVSPEFASAAFTVGLRRE